MLENRKIELDGWQKKLMSVVHSLSRTVMLALIVAVPATLSTATAGGEPAAYDLSPELLEEIARQEKIYPDQSVGAQRYGRPGHQYTTFIVAALAGFSKEKAHKFAYFSQFPDDVKKFSATSAAIQLFNLTYRKQIMATLHSLHGGGENDVLKRRKDLKEFIQDGIETGSLEDYQIGLSIHAFADSYAHTKMKDGELVAYGYGVGHLFHGHTPDVIAYYPDKFRDYSCELFKALSLKTKCGKELKEFLSMIDRLKTSRDEELLKFEEYAQDEKKFGNNRFDPAYHKHQGDIWKGGVKKEEVLATIVAIERKIAGN